jgi:hypothetical protein
MKSIGKIQVCDTNAAVAPFRLVVVLPTAASPDPFVINTPLTPDISLSRSRDDFLILTLAYQASSDLLTYVRSC